MKQEIIERKEEKSIKLNQVETLGQEDINIKASKQSVFIILLIFLSAFLLLSFYWLYSNTGNVTIEQLLFHLKVPVKGTNLDMVWDYMGWTFWRVFILVLISAWLVFFCENIKWLKERNAKKILYCFSKFLLLGSIIIVLCITNVFGFIKNQITASTFIEEQYVDPSTAEIVFPEKKQNLIYIYLESMENTFASTAEGGIYRETRIPELSKIAQQNISFSNTDKLGGAFNLEGTHWTIAAMVSQTGGIPLKISIEMNSYGNHATFLPGAYSLGQILEQNGYKNYLLLGSDAEFGGRKSYFESHGNYEIWDFNSAVEEQRMSLFEKVWWGYSDQDLFKYAKEQLTEIAKKEEPFNYTLLTVDTHFTDGYVCEVCNTEHFEDQYSNVIKCSSTQVAEFVEWIKQQPFYEDTTIIITGDHITMQPSIEEETKAANYEERTIYNAFINSKVDTQNTKNRKFFTMDMYPTTLAAIGAQIKGERLALGTNLFSEEKTLAEKFGVENVRKEIEKKSKFYNKKLLYNE